MRFRPPVLDDAVAVLAVLTARETADLGVAVYRLDWLRELWQAADFQLEHDARVAELDTGRIVGYAAVGRHGALAAVAPDHEGRGIGARLLEWAERREREFGHSLHRQWTAALNASARALLTRAGYAKARSYWRLARPLDGITPVAPPPDGVSLRTVDGERVAARLHAIDEASFANAPGYTPTTLGTFREEHLQADDFDAGLSLVAERDGQIVAFLLARRHDDEVAGFVSLLAVDPEHQRRGIGIVLLQQAFAGFATAGLREAQLLVASDNLRALRVYERAGMAVQLQFDIYERPVDS